MAYIPLNSKREGYIVPIHEPLYIGSIYTNTPRNLNYRRSGVQDWTTRKPTPPQSEQLAQRYSRLENEKVHAGQIPPAATTSHLLR